MLNRGRQTDRPQDAFYVQRASDADEAVIRRLLRRAPMQGAIQVSLQREPDANLAADVEGVSHATVLVRERGNDELLGMGSRAVRPVYFNGAVRDMGYLGQLRASPGRNGIRRLVAGFNAIAETRREQELPFDLTSIISDNAVAMRLLQRGLRGLPHYCPLSTLSTFIIPTGGPWLRRRGLSAAVRVAERVDMAAVAECLQGYLAQYQFAPYWDMPTLLDDRRCNNLKPQDFLVIRDNERISSCAAIWDQRAFKQVVINGYSGLIARTRPALNLLFKMARKPRLPRAPGDLALAYLSHLAVSENDSGHFVALLQSARRVAARRGLDYLVLGFTERHPLRRVVKRRFPHYEYASTLYTVHWNPANMQAEQEALRGSNIPHLEVAIL